MNAREAVWREARGPQRVLFAVALLFFASAIVHIGVYALSSGPSIFFDGTRNWRP